MYLQVKPAKLVTKKDISPKVWRKPRYIQFGRNANVTSDTQKQANRENIMLQHIKHVVDFKAEESLDIERARERYLRLRSELTEAKRSIQKLQRDHTSLRDTLKQYKPQGSNIVRRKFGQGKLTKTVSHSKKRPLPFLNERHPSLMDIRKTDVIAITSKIVDERKDHWKNVVLPTLQRQQLHARQNVKPIAVHLPKVVMTKGSD